MPLVSLHLTYAVQFTGAEYKLVTMALAGMLKPGSNDARDALVLNERLCAQRVAELKVANEIATGAHAKAIEKREAADNKPSTDTET